MSEKLDAAAQLLQYKPLLSKVELFDETGNTVSIRVQHSTLARATERMKKENLDPDYCVDALLQLYGQEMIDI